MKEFWIIISLVVALIVVGLLAYFKSDTPLTPDYDDVVKVDTTQILLNDKLRLLDLEGKNRAELEQLLKNCRDTTVNTVDSIDSMVENFKTVVKGIHDLKNDELFPIKEEYYQLKSKELNIWAIIFIVLISGALGGFARTKDKLVEELFKDVEEAQELMSQIGDGKGGLDTKMANVLSRKMNSINDKVISFRNKAEAGEEDNSEKVIVNIIFGIIASSLSFLALITFSSKVLDFQSDIDYFIFLGWCLMGALFAKNWIKSLYNKITN